MEHFAIFRDFIFTANKDQTIPLNARVAASLPVYDKSFSAEHTDELIAQANCAADLLEALKEIVRGDVGATYSGSQCVEIAEAAIAKAEGK